MAISNINTTIGVAPQPITNNTDGEMPIETVGNSTMEMATGPVSASTPPVPVTPASNPITAIFTTAKQWLGLGTSSRNEDASTTSSENTSETTHQAPEPRDVNSDKTLHRERRGLRQDDGSVYDPPGGIDYLDTQGTLKTIIDNLKNNKHRDNQDTALNILSRLTGHDRTRGVELLSEHKTEVIRHVQNREESKKSPLGTMSNSPVTYQQFLSMITDAGFSADFVSRVGGNLQKYQEWEKESSNPPRNQPQPQPQPPQSEYVSRETYNKALNIIEKRNPIGGSFLRGFLNIFVDHSKLS